MKGRVRIGPGAAMGQGMGAAGKAKWLGMGKF